VSDDLHRTLAAIVDFLSSQAIQFALIGGIATGVHGEPRFTADVDLVVGIDIERALELIGLLGPSEFLPLFADVAAVVQQAFILPLRHRETRVRVDLAIGMTGFEHKLIARAGKVTIAERLVPVASAEDLILLKLLASRPRDMEDIASIVTRQGPTLDWSYLLSTGEALQEAVAQDLLTPLRKLATPPPSE
jgi:hypothetical protein